MPSTQEIQVLRLPQELAETKARLDEAISFIEGVAHHDFGRAGELAHEWLVEHGIWATQEEMAKSAEGAIAEGS